MNVLLAGQSTKSLAVDRSTQLPSIYRDAMKNVGGIEITTYGDLAFVSQMEPMPEKIALGLVAIKETGFDIEVLKRIV